MKPLLFRFHRGGLDESMETVTEVESFEHLMELIETEMDLEISHCHIMPYVKDDRIDWNTHLVRIVAQGSHQGFFPVGYLNRYPDWETCHYGY